MTVEIRYIAFSPTEVLRAITDYRRKRRQPLPPGSVVGLQVRAGAEVAVETAIARDGAPRPEIVVVAGQHLGAALVLYCIDNRIPVPARAHKALFPGGDGGVVLGYALGLDDAGRATFERTAPPIVAPARAAPEHAPAAFASGVRPSGAAASAEATSGGEPPGEGLVLIDDPAAAAAEPAPAAPAPTAPTPDGAPARRRRAFEYQMRRAERRG